MMKGIFLSLNNVLLFGSLINAKPTVRGSGHVKDTRKLQWGQVDEGFFDYKKTAKSGYYNDDYWYPSHDEEYYDGVPLTWYRVKTLHVTNLAFNQPFSPFFVMSHNGDAEPIYTVGEPPSSALQNLAENGVPNSLLDVYNNATGVAFARTFSENAPYFVGGSFNISVPFVEGFNRVTIASMAINTNDAFVAINGEPLRQVGDTRFVQALDAGSEENNENCASIPGPGCPMYGNVASGNGEGVVHTHRGFQGVGNLLPKSSYDWRNPMMKVELVDIAWESLVTGCPYHEEFTEAINMACEFEEGISCEYGSETCCGETHPSEICECNNGLFTCRVTDACLVPC